MGSKAKLVLFALLLPVVSVAQERNSDPTDLVWLLGGMLIFIALYAALAYFTARKGSLVLLVLFLLVTLYMSARAVFVWGTSSFFGMVLFSIFAATGYVITKRNRQKAKANKLCNPIEDQSTEEH